MTMQPSPSQRQALELVAAGLFVPDLVREEDGWHARWRPWATADASVARWLDAYVRQAAVTPLTADAENEHHPTLHDAWAMALRGRTGRIRWSDAECAAFAAVLREWHRNAADGAALRSTLVFRFDARSDTVSCPCPRQRESLRALGEAVAFFSPLRLMKPKGKRLVAHLSHGEAESFLAHGARALKAAGYGVEGCDLGVAVSVQADLVAPERPNDETLLPKLTVRVAGKVVTAAEIRFLLEQESSLVYFHGHWIEVDRNILKEALRALEKASSRKLTRIEALAFASGIGRIGRFELEEVATHGWLRGLINDLRQSRSAQRLPRRRPSGPEPSLFAGTLRDYQKRGVAWLSFLTDNGFGALLADDMGLGKTIQVIAWITRQRAASAAAARTPVLIVAPLTLLANWRHEFAAFAPKLRLYVHSGKSRAGKTAFRRLASEADVILTSYPLLVRDHATLGEIAWQAMILDEAQAIKNPDTAVASAVRALTPPKRIALTGTPIENSVADIWSLEEFLNPGFLGDRKAFAERFAKPLAADPHAQVGARLRHALEPFVLRRLKSDATIAAELGPKREIREYCSLAPRSRADYEDALAVYRTSRRRRGDIFALLTRLKLVCDGIGKFERLTELLETIFANGEKALVFTQYAKIGRELKTRLETHFGRELPFLHGNLSTAQREAEINRFRQAAQPTAFILSLKTGGFGLNLTEATHVIHYDRWWNPAVENQATDRAHRIGQSQTVFVHMMITSGTIEEHVDEILSHKSALSGGLVTSGEEFLTQLPNELFEKAVSLDE